MLEIIGYATFINGAYALSIPLMIVGLFVIIANIEKKSKKISMGRTDRLPSDQGVTCKTCQDLNFKKPTPTNENYTRYCPKCLEWFGEDQFSCPTCGCSLNPSNICPECGTVLND